MPLFCNQGRIALPDIARWGIGIVLPDNDKECRRQDGEAPPCDEPCVRAAGNKCSKFNCWGMWMAMRDHAGPTALAYDDDDCKFGGALNVAVDNGSVITWDNDNEYGGEFGLDTAELEYGEGHQLKDESQDSRLFDKTEGRVSIGRQSNSLAGNFKEEEEEEEEASEAVGGEEDKESQEGGEDEFPHPWDFRVYSRQ